MIEQSDKYLAGVHIAYFQEIDCSYTKIDGNRKEVNRDYYEKYEQIIQAWFY